MGFPFFLFPTYVRKKTVETGNKQQLQRESGTKKHTFRNISRSLRRRHTPFAHRSRNTHTLYSGIFLRAHSLSPIPNNPSGHFSLSLSYLLFYYSSTQPESSSSLFDVLLTTYLLQEVRYSYLLYTVPGEEDTHIYIYILVRDIHVLE